MKKYKIDYKVNNLKLSRIVEASGKRDAENKLIKGLIEEGYTGGKTLRVSIAK